MPQSDATKMTNMLNRFTKYDSETETTWISVTKPTMVSSQATNANRIPVWENVELKEPGDWAYIQGAECKSDIRGILANGKLKSNSQSTHQGDQAGTYNVGQRSKSYVTLTGLISSSMDGELGAGRVYVYLDPENKDVVLNRAEFLSDAISGNFERIKSQILTRSEATTAESSIAPKSEASLLGKDLSKSLGL